jgi:hypothetical protein
MLKSEIAEYVKQPDMAAEVKAKHLERVLRTSKLQALCPDYIAHKNQRSK